METLGCPKNQVDSDKLCGTLVQQGYHMAEKVEDADLVVVNTCAFIEPAREESIETILELSELKKPNAQLVATGCMAERYGKELADSLPEADLVVGFGVPVTISTKKRHINSKDKIVPSLDLLNLSRPKTELPWAYIKVAEGCDRKCGFCAIPSFRGPQRSRTKDSIIKEIQSLDIKEAVLVAQDLASYGKDIEEDINLVSLIKQVSKVVERTRVLYLYPSQLTSSLIDAICETNVPYFDLSLQHVSPKILRRMKRWGNSEKFLTSIEAIRSQEPEAVFRSSFIIGYPGETEQDHDDLLSFLAEARLDWAGFFAYSAEPGTYAYGLEDSVDPYLVSERLNEASQLQDSITVENRSKLIGQQLEVLVDKPGIGRSWRESPEIDGIIRIPNSLKVGTSARVEITGIMGIDLESKGVLPYNAN